MSGATGTRALFDRNVLASYGRFDLELTRGNGSYVWDAAGRRYLDLGGGIAVCSLGHANGEIADALHAQARILVHVSNLYYTEPQGRLAEQLVRLIGPGRVFFCNSGAEANEGLYKLARKFGHDRGRFEVITAENSFHGRTLAGIAATGQEKVKKGFEPAVIGFRHVPYNDLKTVKAAITNETAAVLMEAIQGESGVVPAHVDYLLGLRQLCDEHGLLLLLDEVQAGHFRTGRFQSWQRLLENTPGAESFLPDGVSMAKSLGGGFPLGAFWVREDHASLLGAGSHATTFGGSPLGCAMALKIMEVIARDGLADHARKLGASMVVTLREMQTRFPRVMSEVRGVGLMIGIEFDPRCPAFARSESAPALQLVNRLHELGVLTVPAASSVIRLLPALNLSEIEAAEGLRVIEKVVTEFAS
ncbi:MAG: acetylornithine/succinylornithine family transaminase [Verrucomicrobiota bacterium]|nr:acetylornithine/succinylornithine family transaminase [Verrucomicrobiota bacterium]